MRKSGRRATYLEPHDRACVSPAVARNGHVVRFRGSSRHSSDLMVSEGQVHTYDALGRRFLVSISVSGPARGLRLLSNSLTVTTLGGTLRGWAALSAANASSGTASSGSAASRTQTTDFSETRAVEVIPGRIRVAPFLSGTTLHAQTAALDMLVVPGGRQIDAMIASTDAMWTAQRQPVPADELRIALTPIRNSTYSIAWMRMLRSSTPLAPARNVT